MLLAQVDPISTLNTAAEFGWATFVLVLLIVLLAGFLWLWLNKVAIPSLDERRRHNAANEKILRDLSEVIRDLKRSMEIHEALARRSQRYYEAMSSSKKIELKILEAIAHKVGASVNGMAKEASRVMSDAGKKTDYGFDAVDDSGDEIPTL